MYLQISDDVLFLSWVSGKYTGRLYRYKRMPFGLMNAASDYQSIIMQILAGLEGVISVMDDILVYGPNEKIHDERLELVLERLKSFDFVLNEKKCVFGAKEIDFLGWRISKQGFKPTVEKIEAIKNFRRPENAEEIRSFLGLVNFVGNCILNLATLSAPLRFLLKKNVKFQWTLKEQTAFEDLKKALSSDRTLCFFDPGAEVILMVDASPVGLGAILLQEKAEGWKMVACAAKSLTDTEKKYCQLEREALSIVFGIERFRYYLTGRKFRLYTDCKPLEFMFSPKSKPCARVERWVLRVQSFDFEIIHKPGSQNIADCLSRLVKQGEELPIDATCEYSLRHILEIARPVAITLQQIREEGDKDDEIVEVKKALRTGKWDKVASGFSSSRAELCVVDGILLKIHKIVVPKSLRVQILQLVHESHQGIVAMKARLRSKVWWPGVDKDVENLVKQCKDCVLVSLPSKPEPLHATRFPENAWEAIALDFKGPLPSGVFLLVIIDYYSKFAVVEVLHSLSAAVLIKHLIKIFALFGAPTSLRADNGPQMNCEEFKNFCVEWNIKLIFSTPYWPQANGEVERFNRTLGKHLAISRNMGSDWKEDINKFLLAYHSTVHPSTGKSPGELMLKRKLREKIPTMMLDHNGDESVKEKAMEAKEKMKEYADRKRKAAPSNIIAGDEVVLLNTNKKHKLDSNFTPEEHEVIEKKGGELVVRSKESGKIKRRHVSHAKKIEKNTSITQSNNSLPATNTTSSPIDYPPTTSTDHPAASATKKVLVEPTDAEEDLEKGDATAKARPKRKIKTPSRFLD